MILFSDGTVQIDLSAQSEVICLKEKKIIVTVLKKDYLERHSCDAASS